MFKVWNYSQFCPPHGPSFLGHRACAVPTTSSQIESKKKFLLEPSIFQAIHNIAHAGPQKGGVPEEAEIGRTSTIRDFLHALQAPSMTAYPRDAVSAAEPLCTHGKDHAGLGAPNSLKLFLLIVLLGG